MTEAALQQPAQKRAHGPMGTIFPLIALPVGAPLIFGICIGTGLRGSAVQLLAAARPRHSGSLRAFGEGSPWDGRQQQEIASEDRLDQGDAKGECADDADEFADREAEGVDPKSAAPSRRAITSPRAKLVTWVAAYPPIT